MGISSNDGEGTWHIATNFQTQLIVGVPNLAPFLFLDMVQNIRKHYHIGIETHYATFLEHLVVQMFDGRVPAGCTMSVLLRDKVFFRI